MFSVMRLVGGKKNYCFHLVYQKNHLVIVFKGLNWVDYLSKWGLRQRMRMVKRSGRSGAGEMAQLAECLGVFISSTHVKC